jgi:hypothetical protein
LIAKSLEFLEASKNGIHVEANVRSIKKITSNELTRYLTNDRQKQVFWINIYNAFIQVYGKGILPKYKGKELKFFSLNMIEIAGEEFSFNDIEHGILRRSQWIYGLGYIPKLFTSSVEKSRRVGQLDYRIHFLLNCGAESCPMIYNLTEENIDEVLLSAQTDFIQNEIEVIEEENFINASKIFQFYLGDFGGRKGIKELVGNQLKIDLSSYQLKFKDYNWSLKMGNFKKYETKVISN